MTRTPVAPDRAAKRATRRVIIAFVVIEAVVLLGAIVAFYRR